MEAIIFCGIQASGKSTFYKARYFKSHVHISMDLLNTRHREQVFLNACISTQMRFVVDNTNPTAAERRKYIDLAKSARYKIIGYYFLSNPDEALARNELREGKEKIPRVGLMSTLKKLAPPRLEEGFDEIFLVKIGDNNQFEIKEYQNEI